MQLVSRRAAVVAGLTVLLAGTGGAALALSGHGIGSSTERGNEQPIDDNHPPTAPVASPAASPANAAVATPASTDNRPATATATSPSPERTHDTREAEPGDDHGSTAEPGDDHGGHGGDGSGNGSDDGGSGGHGADG